MTQYPLDDEEVLSGRTAVTPVSTDDGSGIDPGFLDHLEPLGVTADDDDHSGLPPPVWLSESSKDFRWRWVPLPLRKAWRVTIKWLGGPDPPQDLLFQPFFPRIQETPIRLRNRFFPKKKHKVALLLAVYFIWFLTWSLVLRHTVASGHIEGYGVPTPLSCTASYW